MKFVFRIIFKMFLILTILFGCEYSTPFNQGVTLLDEGQYDQAIAYFNEALEINPRYADAYDNRGLAYYYKGQYDKACSDWRRACELYRGCDWELRKRKDVCK